MSDSEVNQEAKPEVKPEVKPETHINLKVSDGSSEIFFKIKKTTPLRRLMEAFAKRQGKEMDSLRFLYDGIRIQADQTPEDLDMEDNDIIEAHREQIGGSSHSTIPKRTVPPGRDLCPCDGCGTKVDVEEGLICDECDTMYHFACVKLLNPDIKQVPAIWHCSTCSFKKKELAADTTNNVAHDCLHGGNCVLCDQLELVKTEEEDPKLPIKIELAEEREGSSVSSMGEDNEPDLSTTALSNLCKHCGTCEDDDKRFMVCGHPYCVYKFYHIRCLKTSQLAIEQQKKLGCWYCPSCLCRGCFQDKDDDQIVMCDGCDEGYHIYCMRPARNTIPKGKWYCTFCKIRRAAEGMHKYEDSVLKIHGNSKHACNVNQSKDSEGDGTEK